MLVVNTEKFKMEIKESQRIVHIRIIGFIRDEMVPEYLEGLMETVNRVQPSTYTLVIDATDQSPLPRKTAAELGQTMLGYTTFGFKHIKMVMPKSKISYVQVRNGLEEVNFPGEIVDYL